MYNGYFEELKLALDSTTISYENNSLPLYNEGIDYLTKIFKRYKATYSQTFFIGNGGSAAIASHMTADFMKNGGMKTISLYDASVMTCMSNDYGYEHIFSTPLNLLGASGDFLVAISSSGNSQNIVNACQTAKDKDMFVVTFTGFDSDNKVSKLGDVNVYVPCSEYGKVESIHQIILQQIVDTMRERI